MPLSDKHLQDVCLLGSRSSQQCRYLHRDDLDPSKWHCCKLQPDKKRKIDSGARDFIKKRKRQGRDPYADNVPLGDNCPGYPVLRIVQQGYDVD